MSDQTPNSSEDLNGSEPSMEDILASIRKIISDDEPVALESPEDVSSLSIDEKSPSAGLNELMQDIHVGSNDLTSDAVLDAVSAESEALTDSFAGEGESVDLNIDDVLAGLDEDILDDSSETVAVEAAVSSESEVEDEALSALLDDFVAEPENQLVDAVNEASDVPTPEVLDADISEPDLLASDPIDPESGIFDDDDDILSLLNDDFPVEETSSVDLETLSDDIEMPTVDAAAAELEALDLAPPADALVSENTSLESLNVGDDVEMDALLDDILLETPETEVLVEPDLDAGIADVQAESEAVSQDVSLDDELVTELGDTEELSDLELVKSLMADLADDPGELESGDDLDAMLAIPEIGGDADVLEGLADSEVEPESDILGEILDMTLEDELNNSPTNIDLSDDAMSALEDVAAAQADNITENALPIDEMSLDDVLGADEGETALPSLSEIAAAAEADAVAVETIQAPQAAAAATGLAAAIGGAALGKAALSDTDDTSDVKVEAPQIEQIVESLETSDVSEAQPEPILEPISTQETSMPVKAVQTDAILDEVTEAATSGAFAELNQVVEDKAVFNERGPRIGDLVQDALRPMLKEWLDANLKGIVERAVTKEVKRISKGG